MKTNKILMFLIVAIFSGCPKQQSVKPDKQKTKVKVKKIKKTLVVDKDLIPRKIIFGNLKKAAIRISPDGKKLSYIAPVKGVFNVWVQTIGKDDAKVVTNDTYRGIRSYFWSYDSNSLFYAQDKGGNEDFHVYQVQLNPHKIKPLTPYKGVRASIIAISRLFPDTILLSMNKRDKKVFDVYRYNLKTGKMVLDTQNPGNIVGWTADYKLKIRAALAMDKNAQKILMVRNSVKSKWRTIRKWNYLESGGPLAFSKNGKSIYVMGNKGSDKTRLFSITIRNKKIKEIFTNPKADMSGVTINPEDNRIEAVTTEYIQKEWTAIDPKFQKDIDAMKKLAGKNRFGISSRSKDDKLWIVAVGGPSTPSKYYLYKRVDGTFKLLMETRKELKKYKLNIMKPVVIKSRDGLDLVSYLTTPAKPFKGKQPMILLVHGGPWHRDKYSWRPMVQWLANRGYVVLQVNFRGSTGFGKKFLNAGNKEWGRKMQHDLTDAVGWAVKNANIDPKRVGIMGGSYGGYAALAGITFTPDLYAAAVDIVGPSSIITLLKTIPQYWKPIMSLFTTRVGDLKKDVKMLNERSPLNYVNKIKTPLAIFQGKNDPRVKITESNQIVKAIRTNKGKVLYIVYPDEGHGFRREPNKMDFLARTEQFLAKYLKGRVEPYLKKLEGSTALIK
jgi:dipeptidyl aminopeptidase/acylaminoacyl peptidase